MTQDGQDFHDTVAAAVTGAQGASVTFTSRDADFFVADTTAYNALDTYLRTTANPKWNGPNEFHDEHPVSYRYQTTSTAGRVVEIFVHVGADDGL
jgi:hypothetical protein